MSDQIWLWIAFNIFVLLMLALDLGVYHRKSHTIGLKEALIWSAFWILLSFVFALGVYLWSGSGKAVEFVTGYLIEKSLSLDNLFVFLLIFSYFNVPSQYQYKALFWGILGAIIMRAILIAVGITLIRQFHWIIYVFGAFLVFTGIKMALQKDRQIQPERNPVLRLFRKYMPVTKDYEHTNFFVIKSGKRLATPLFIVLLVIETTDVMFALDSIPAILAVTKDPFIVYSSNIFAILGLRALYFALAGIMRKFHYLHYGLSIILVLVGVKMLIESFYEIPVEIVLIMVAAILLISVIVSFVKGETSPVTPDSDDTESGSDRQKKARTMS